MEIGYSWEMLNKYRQILLTAIIQSLWNWIFHLLPSQNKRGLSGSVPLTAIWRHVEVSRVG